MKSPFQILIKKFISKSPLSVFVLASLVFILSNPIIAFTSYAETNHVKKKPKSFRILALGDSLTDGYGLEQSQAFPKKLEERLHKNGFDFVEVVNAGISGSTSSTAPSRLRWQLRSRPDLMILALGANDGLRGVPIETTKKNLTQTIKMAKEENVKVILAGMLLPPNYGEEYRTQFSEMFKEISKEQSVPLIPFLLEGVAGEPRYNLEDAIHPNERGHEKIAENVYKHLLPHLPKKSTKSNSTEKSKNEHEVST